MKKTVVFATSLLVLPLLGGCAAALVGAGATGGYYAAQNKEVGQYADDSVITGKLKAKYIKDFSLRSLNISVATSQSVVTLTGNVSSKTLRNHAISVAKKTSGVKSVDASNLRISSN